MTAAQSLAGLLLGWRLLVTLPSILLLSVVAGRLLGVKRSVGASLLSGVVGWFAGALLTLVIANNDTNREAGFTRNLWLFTTFFTMSSAVWMELLAKPGALARAQSGLATVPRPLRALRRKSGGLSRYVQIPRIVARTRHVQPQGMAPTA